VFSFGVSIQFSSDGTSDTLPPTEFLCFRVASRVDFSPTVPCLINKLNISSNLVVLWNPFVVPFFVIQKVEREFFTTSAEIIPILKVQPSILLTNGPHIGFSRSSH